LGGQEQLRQPDVLVKVTTQAESAGAYT